MGGDDRGIIEGIVPDLIVKSKDDNEAIDSSQQVDPPPRPTSCVLPSSALGVDLFQHVHPTRQERQDEDGKEKSLDEDTEDIGLENSDEVVRIIEEDDGNRKVDHHALLGQDTVPIFKPKTINKKASSEDHYSQEDPSHDHDELGVIVIHENSLYSIIDYCEDNFVILENLPINIDEGDY